MPSDMSPHVQIMQAVLHKPGCTLEDLVLECPVLTWNQVFLEQDRLSRHGEVRLTVKGPGQYVVTPADPARWTASV